MTVMTAKDTTEQIVELLEAAPDEDPAVAALDGYASLLR